MADYVSKYTGSEVDGILEDAIELPQGSSEDVGKFLKYTGDTHPVEWDNIEVLPAYGCSDYADSILTVRYQSGEGNVVSWYKAGYEDAGKFLKYGSNGLEWDNPIDISEASNKDVLMYVGGTALIGWRDPFNIFNANDGDFLKYDGNGDITWDNPIDTTNANDGDVLKYDGNGNFISWGKPIDTTGANDGEFLRYDGHGDISWGKPIDTQGGQEGSILSQNSSNELCWTNLLNLLPSCNDTGSVLKYGSNGLEWDSVLPTGGSHGDVLTVGDCGRAAWGSPFPSGGNDGDVLTYNGTGGPFWQTILPSHNTDGYDQGKVLGINQNDELEWMAPSDAQALYDSQNNS